MKKLFTILLTVLFGLYSLTLSAQESTLTVADGTETNDYIPIYGLYVDDPQHNQVVYPASMLTDMVGNAITSITFYAGDSPDWGNISYTVSLGTTSTESLTSLLTDPVDVVFSGHVDFSNNQLTFVFDDGFLYSGGNLLFDIANTSSTWASSYFYGISTTNTPSIYQYSYGGSPQSFLPKTTFTYSAPVGCQKPNELQISGITTSSALFSWHPRATGTSYVAIDAIGADPATLNWISVTDTFYTFSSLTPGTGYVAYVRTDCGSEYSNNATISFYTACEGVNDFPWFEDFEGSWPMVTAFGQQNNSPLCWSIYDGSSQGTYKWKISPQNTSSYNYSYEGDYAAACYTNDYYGYEPHNEWLVTPMLNLTSDLQLSFYVMGSGSYYGDEISVWISNENATLVAPDTATSPLPGFTQILSLTNLPEDYLLYEIPLTGYTGSRYIAFACRNLQYGYYTLLDNVTVGEIPPCQRPFNLGTDSTGTTFADLTWTSDASTFNVYYKPADADSYMVNENVILNGDSIYTLTDLTPGQAYVWYVEAICDNDTLLASILPSTFNTECVAITTLPQTWGFESNNIGGSEYYSLPACWSRTSYQYPYVYSSDYYSHHGNQCLYMYGTSPELVVLPELDPSFSIGNLQLTLWVTNSNSGDGYIIVGAMTDPSDPTTFTPIDTINNIINIYTEYLVPLTGYNGTAHYVAMKMNGGQYPSSYDGSMLSDYMYIDDVTLEILPSCPRPENVTVSNVTSDAATLTWLSEENGFNVYYKVDGAASYTAITDGPVTENTYTLTELQPNTTYTVVVTSVCSDGTETYSLPAYFMTTCVALDSLPYTCGFETINTMTSLPDCWTRGDLNTTYPYIYDYSYYAYTGNRSLYFSTVNTAAMPAIDTNEYNLTDYMLTFYAKANDNNTPLQVGVMTDPSDHNTFVQVGNDILLTTNYTFYEVSFANFTGNGAYVAFRNVTPYYGLYVDDVNLIPIPDCSRPMEFTCAVGTDEATVTWNMLEGQSEWEVVFGTNITDPDQETSEDVTTNSYTFTNLTPNTQYKLFVRTVCGDQTSDWSNVYIFNTLPFEPAVLPYSCTFEDTVENAKWTMVNSASANKWYIDTAANNTIDGVYGLYISADSGVTNSYEDNNTTVWAYRDFQFGQGTEFKLKFDWRCMGESAYYDYDYMKVYIGNPVAVSANTSYDYTVPAGITELALYKNSGLWNSDSLVLDASNAESVRRIYFMWHNDSYGNYAPSAAVDNISLEAVSCARPTAVNLIDITTNSVTLNLSTPGADMNTYAWEININDSVIIVNDSTPTINNLVPGSAYQITVRTLCDAGDTSVYSDPVSFLTECILIAQIPQSWDFESDLIAGTESYPMPVCWNKISTSYDYSYPYAYDYAEYAHSGNHALYFSNTYPNSYAILPAIDTDLLPLQNLQISFYSSMSSINNVFLEVGVMTDPSDPSTFTLVQSVSPVFNIYGSEPIVVTFDEYTGSGNYIAMRNTVIGSANSRISVDDVTLEAIPSCPPPSAVTITDVTANSATIGWTENGDATTWNLEYTPVGGTPVVIPVTTNPYTLTNLASTTTFNVRVQAECSASDVSTWSGMNSFATEMVAASLPYSTDFSPNGDTQWYLNNGIAPNRWVIGNTNGSSALFISNDGTTAGYNVSASSTAMAEKLFTMPADATVHVEFDLIVGGETGSYSPYDFLKVFLTSGSETFTAGTNTITQSAYDYSANAMDFTAYTGLGTSGFPYIAALSNGNTIHISADMTNPNPNGGGKIVFLWRNDFMDGTQPGAVIKNFSIGNAPAVTDPTVATEAVSNVAQTTATLNGTITNPDNVTITAKGFEWKATTGGTYTPVTVTGNTLTYDLTNLTANTSYTYKAFITFNGTTVYGNEVTFTTLQQGQQTEPSVTTNAADPIAQTTATLKATISNPDNVTITAKGFEWKTTTGGTYTSVTGTGTGNTFTANLTNLTPNTSYTYKALITFNGTTVYGNEVTFTTMPEDTPEPCNTPTGLTVSGVTDESITITWNADANVSSWNIQYSAAGGTLNSASSNTNSYTISGLTPETTYTIQVQANCGDGNLSEWSTSVTGTTTVGLENWLENSVNLYPNPAKEVVYVQCTMNNVQSVEVFDVYGKLVNTVGVCDTPVQTRISVSGLADGMYFVRVTTEAGVVTKSFVKK